VRRDRRRPDLRSAAGALSLCWRAGRTQTATFFVISAFSGFVPAVTVWLTKLLIDGVADRHGTGELFVLVGVLGSAGVVAAVLARLAAYLRADLGRRVDVHLQECLYSAVNRLDGLTRLESPRYRDRLQIAQQSTGGSLGPATTGLFAIGQQVITVVGLMVAVALVAPLMAVLVVLAALPVLVAELLLSRKRVTMVAELSPSVRRRIFYSMMLVDLRAAKEIRLLGLGKSFTNRMRLELSSIHRQERQLDLGELRVQATLALLTALVTGASLVYPVLEAAQGRLTIGDISVYVGAVVGVQGALGALVAQVAGAYEALAIYGHFRAITATGNDLAIRAGTVPMPELRQYIEFRDVWFRYGEDLPWVLRGVSLKIPYGTATAIVGLNGAGKSTLVKLLCRFYDPTRGAVLWDGVDLRDVPVPELRQRIGALFQDFMSYDFTAAENIAVGDIHRIDNRDEVVAAAQRAGVHGTLAALPNGYDTMLGLMFSGDDDDSGVTLSGGQWQRIALARGLLRDDRDLLILDEPSAGLDPEAEHSIHEGLRRLRMHRTSVLISHRLGSIRDADLIVVLDGGRVAEEGTHATLMARGGQYARLFGLQASGYAHSG